MKKTRNIIFNFSTTHKQICLVVFLLVCTSGVSVDVGGIHTSLFIRTD